MFDLRYHVVSMAAVFLALTIGILVGVGLTAGTDVGESERAVLEQRITDLQRGLDDANGEVDLLRQQQRTGTEYIDRSYDAVMNGRLRGVRVALLFVGPAKAELRDRVTETLRDASGPELVRIRALQLPLDAERVRNALPPDSAELTLDDVGRRLGREFVTGGDTPLWDALAPVIVVESQGGFRREADAVVVAATAAVDERPTARLVSGLYGALAGSGGPVVGVERTDEQPSRIALYKTAGFSSVDSVDTPAGRVALAVVLAGGDDGSYGVKPTATEGVVPPIESLQLAAPAGG